MNLWENFLSPTVGTADRHPAADARTAMLGVPIDDQPLATVLALARAWLRGTRQRYIATPNPEMLAAATTDAELKAALRQADLRIPDGVGLVLASYLYGRPIRHRLTGTDLLNHLMAVAAEQGSTVYLLGGAPGVAAGAAANFLSRYPALNVVGATDGGIIDPTGQAPPAVIAAITRARPTLLVVAFGHGKQERFMVRYLKHLPSVRVAIGVGGALDYWSGKLPRAGGTWRRLGLEWLYRLGRQPSRFRRVLRATVLFPWFVLLDSFTRHAQHHD